MTLAALVLVAMTVLGKPERVPPSEPLAVAIAAAVSADDEGRLTGSAEGDAVYIAIESYQETRWGWHWEGRAMAHSDCPEGDGGRSLGYLQVQARREIACNLAFAVPTWLHWAHGSQHRCSALPLDERLAELHSGTCALGHALSRWRWRQIRPVLDAVRAG